MGLIRCIITTAQNPAVFNVIMIHHVLHGHTILYFVIYFLSTVGTSSLIMVLNQDTKVVFIICKIDLTNLTNKIVFLFNVEQKISWAYDNIY